MTKERQAVLVKKERRKAEVELNTYGMSGAKTRSLEEKLNTGKGLSYRQGSLCRV